MKAFDDEIPNCIIDAEVLLYKDNVLLDTLIIDLENSDYIYYWSNTGEDSLLMYYYKSNYVPTGGHLYKIMHHTQIIILSIQVLLFQII